MAAKVSYKQGTKQTYLSLIERSSNALYFCTDTKELFKGDDLYSDGLRTVPTYSSLPEFIFAADGILYFCEDSGCGYVLDATRTNWLQVIFGIDNDTISINENGLMAVKTVAITKVAGLSDELTRIEALALHGDSAVATKDAPGVIKPGTEFEVSEDGTLSLSAIDIEKVTGLDDRLSAVEQATGVDLSDISTKAEVRTISKLVDYEVSNKPLGTLVNFANKEFRVMCPFDTQWTLQESGYNSDPTKYYIGMKAYAPSGDVVSFKEDMAEIIGDPTMYYFEDNDFAGVDEFGRKYSIVWLPVASYDAKTKSWTYFGSKSTTQKYIGWYYSVEWYNSNGVKVAADTIRINLSNEDCDTNIVPFYVTEVQSTLTALEKAISSAEESYVWGDM